jgi:uridine monophosphate synthetase
MEDEELIIELFNIGCVKFGEFTLKSGLKSPVYFDMRLLISHPKLLVRLKKHIL